MHRQPSQARPNSRRQQAHVKLVLSLYMVVSGFVLYCVSGGGATLAGRWNGWLAAKRSRH
jgi:hypothetical protein